MIYNRTQTDVDNAISIRANKIQNGLELSADEISIMERGTITINTLNRIEDKQDELKNLINQMGYFNTKTIFNRQWSYDDFFDEVNFNRILGNLRILKNAFFVYSNTPPIPTANYSYQNINDLEKILYDMDIMISDIKSRYRQCGTFECGEANEN